MRPKHYWVDLLNTDPNGIMLDQQPNGAATLNGAEVSGGVAYARETEFSRRGPGKGASGSIALHAQRVPQYGHHWARQVEFESAGNWAGVNFTVVGTDQDGFVVSETIAGPNAGVSATTGYFRTVTSISTDGTVATDVEGGFNDLIVSQTIPLDWRRDTGTGISVNVTGTINFTVQETYDPVYDPNFMSNVGGDHRYNDLGGTNVTNYANIHWVDLIAAGAADATATTTRGATAIRLLVNSYTDAAEIDLHIVPEVD